MTTHHPPSSTPGLKVPTEALESFYEDVQYLWCGGDSAASVVPVYKEPPSAIDFLRNHVSLSRPCIIQNAIRVPATTDQQQHHQALHLTLDDLVEHDPNLTLHVDVTPDGHGDCVRKTTKNDQGGNSMCFVKPMEKTMTISTFRKHLRQGRAVARDRKQRQEEEETGQQEEGDGQAQTAIRDRVFPISNSNANNNNNSGNHVDDNNDHDVDLDQCVLYYSRQNDCLRQELETLWEMTRRRNDSGVSDDDMPQQQSHSEFLFPRSFSWAEEAFGVGGPDAVNLWMGDERAVSSMHKDHYDNLFYVLSGEKVFGLCPPADAPFLREEEFVSGRFRHETSSSGGDRGHRWTVALDHCSSDNQNDNGAAEEQEEEEGLERVHWITANVFDTKTTGNNNSAASSSSFPSSSTSFSLTQKYVHPIRNVRVRAGELLYLPSLWFHRVTQSCETIGINYWYDMKFESPHWCYFHFLQQLQQQQQQPQSEQEKKLPSSGDSGGEP